MRKTILILSLLVINYSLTAQNNFDPRVIVLLPRTVEIEEGLNNKIEFYEEFGITNKKNYLIEKRDSLLNVILKDESIPVNQKEHLKNQIEFAQKLNFENNIVWDYTESFHNMLGIYFDSPLVTVDTINSLSSTKQMQDFCKETKADYLINIDSLIVSKYKKGILIKPVFTIYYQNENRKIKIEPLNYYYEQYNESYIKVNNEVIYIYFDDIDARTKILRFIEENGDSEQRKLEYTRNRILLNSFYQGKISIWLRKMIKSSNINIDYDSYVTGIINNDSTKFIAFFISEGNPFDDDLTDWYKISILYGKKQNELWSYEFVKKDMYIRKELSKEEQIKKTFMMTKNIFYFKEKSEELNNEFWNKELFIEYKVRYVI